MSFWVIYGLFLLKAITIVAAVIIILIAIGLLKSKAKGSSAGRLEIKPLHREYHKKQRLIIVQLDKKRRKAMLKALKTTQKAQPTAKHILFVLQFKGDLQASQVAALREEVTAVIQIAQPGDRVVLKLESTGGAVNQYGFCASQLDRLKRANIPLTILIDKVAASGGYMMLVWQTKLLQHRLLILVLLVYYCNCPTLMTGSKSTVSNLNKFQQGSTNVP